MHKSRLTLLLSFFFLFSIPLNSVSAQTIIPQVTFGDLLNNNYQPPSPDYEKIKLFLQVVEENGRKSLASFSPRLPSPIPDLAENIAGYFITPVPTLHPKLEQILAQANSFQSTTYLPAEALAKAGLGQADLNPAKSSYTIAILGDSMTDTLGKDLPHLSSLLKQNYPHKNFVLLNYGQGATNIDQGLYRLTHPTKYLDIDYPPLFHLNPDIIIVESFAYNHWGGELNDLNRHWLALVKIVDAIKNYSPETKIIMLATISPNPKIYGDGILNWPTNRKWDAVITTKAYLQNFINFANAAYLPLADAYNPSLNGDGHGDPKFINPTDNLHPSSEGKLLITQKIVDTIKSFNLIK